MHVRGRATIYSRSGSNPINWTKETRAWKGHCCRDCREVCVVEFLTNIRICTNCEGDRWQRVGDDQVECPRCTEEGVEILGPQTTLKYYDTRTMIDHDGKYVCGKCITPAVGMEYDEFVRLNRGFL